MKRKFTLVERGELRMIADVIANEGHDVDELTKLLGITVDDVIDRFGDRLLENRELFIGAVVEVSDSFEEEPEDDDEASEGPWD